MIESLSVKNFQSHENTKLEFTSGINIILGRSQAGKTALLRALLWLVTNRPSGLRFRSHFADDSPTEVTAALRKSNPHLATAAGNALYVQVRKSPSTKAVYSVGDSNFSGFGKSVPEAVANALNINPDINIQRQLDSPFLITASPSEVASTINRATRLDNTDVWLKQLNRIALAAGRELDSLVKAKARIEEQLAGYSHLDDFERDLEILKRLELRVDRTESELDEILWLADSVDEALEALDSARDLLAVERELEDAEKILDEVDSIRQELDDLVAEWDMLDRRVRDLDRHKVTLRGCRDALADLMRELRVCPFCFSELDDDAIDRVVEQL